MRRHGLALVVLCGAWGLLAGASLPESAAGAELAASVVSGAAQPSRLAILEQWRGEGTGYRERPSFFLIRSLPELQVFWEKHQSGEPVPNVDFGKRMLFVWVPGPGLCGYRVMRAADMQRTGRRWRLELEIERSDSLGAGRWRTPWLIALLPRVDGDIEVVRTGELSHGEARFMPLATIWDMQRERDQPATAALPGVSKSEEASAAPDTSWGENPFGEGPKTPQGRTVSEEIVVKHDPKVAADARAASRTTPARADATTADSAGTGREPAPAAAAAEPAPAAGGQPAATAAKEPPPKTASEEADPFGDAFNLDF